MNRGKCQHHSTFLHAAGPVREAGASLLVTRPPRPESRIALSPSDMEQGDECLLKGARTQLSQIKFAIRGENVVSTV
jgi:hypothetical protein